MKLELAPQSGDSWAEFKIRSSTSFGRAALRRKIRCN